MLFFRNSILGYLVFNAISLFPSFAQDSEIVWSRSFNANTTFKRLLAGGDYSAIWEFPINAPESGNQSASQVSTFVPSSFPAIASIPDFPSTNGRIVACADEKSAFAAVFRLPQNQALPAVEYRSLGAFAPDSVHYLAGLATPLNGSEGILCLQDRRGVIVWGRDNLQWNRTRIFRLDHAGTILWSTEVAGDGSLPLVEISQNASVVLFSDMSRTAVINGIDGSTLYSYFDQTTGTNTRGSFAASNDGKTWAQAKLEGNVSFGYLLASGLAKNNIAPLANFQPFSLDLSPEGLTAAVIYRSYSQSKVVLFSRASSLTTLWEQIFEHTEPSGEQGALSSVKFVEEGRAIIVGYTSLYDESGDPDIKVFRRSSAGMWALASSLIIPGQLQGIETSGFGSKALISSSNSSTATNYATIISSRPVDLKIQGLPRLGNTLQITLRVAPNADARLVKASDTLISPINLGAFGLLRVFRETSVIVQSSRANENGEASFDFAISNHSNLVGTEMAFQGFQLSPRKLTEGFAGFTILP